MAREIYIQESMSRKYIAVRCWKYVKTNFTTCYLKRLKSYLIERIPCSSAVGWITRKGLVWKGKRRFPFQYKMAFKPLWYLAALLRGASFRVNLAFRFGIRRNFYPVESMKIQTGMRPFCWVFRIKLQKGRFILNFLGEVMQRYHIKQPSRTIRWEIDLWSQ